MKIYFYTLGCKVNQYETQLMSQTLSSLGNSIVRADEKPDVIIINSCTVTEESDKKCRKQIRHFRKKYPDSIIAVSGCMTQVTENIEALIPDADIIFGNRNHKHLAEYIERFISEKNKIIEIEPHNAKGEEFESCEVSSFDGHTRAFMKIEDGCNRFCSYCIIPYARGRVRSKLIEDIKSEAYGLYKNGYKEIVLVGINLSAYGDDIGKSIADVLEMLDAELPDVRIRLGSIEADLLTPEIIKKISRCKNLCPQFHLSLQSGCDATLKRMNRKYNSSDYAGLVETIYSNFENPSVTTDIIVGFPGESEEDFCESLSFAKKMRFARSHIFPYSIRPGTVAAKMPDQIDERVKSERCRRMIESTIECENEFLKGQIGKTVSVLFEKSVDGETVGYSENYSEIRVAQDNTLLGKVVSVTVSEADKERLCLIGKVK